MNERFEKNLFILSQRDPDLAKRVREVTSFTGPIPKETPEAASKRWTALDLSSTQVLLVYGIGEGYLYFAARHWLSGHPDRFLAFIEDDIAVIARLLITELGSQLINDPQVKLYFASFPLSQIEKLAPFLDTIAWYFNLLSYQFIALPSYETERTERWKLLKSSLYQVFQDTNKLSAQHHSLGKKEFINMYLNILDLDGAYNAKGLKGKFKGIPAIICGAGPSLAKHIPLLENLKDKAIIFAGGSSVPLLNNHGLEPHFGSTIDPGPPYRRFYLQTAFECPSFYHLNASYDIVYLYHGPRIPVSTASSQLLEKWINEQLGLIPDIIGGHLTVGQLAMKMAAYLGCSPIILLGMDYALTEKKYYGAGLDTARTVVGEEEQTLIIRPDMFGNPVQTKWDWELAVMQISKMAQSMESGRFINSTEGGLGFKGIPNMPFADAAQKYLTQPYDISGHVHATLENTRRIHLSKEKREKIFSQIIESLKRCQAISEELKVELHSLFKNWQKLSPAERDPHQGKTAELFKQLSGEFIYAEVLNFYWKIFSKNMPRYVESLERAMGKDLAAVRYLFEEANFYLLATTRHLEFISSALKEHSGTL